MVHNRPSRIISALCCIYVINILADPAVATNTEYTAQKAGMLISTLLSPLCINRMVCELSLQE
jgi:hypothetical protein